MWFVLWEGSAKREGREGSLVKCGECFLTNEFMLKTLLWFSFTDLKEEFKWEVFQKRFLWKVYMFSNMIYNVKAWFDDYDFNTIKWF